MDLPPLRAIRNVGRFAEIVSVLVRHGFGEVVDQLRLWRYVPRFKRRTIQRASELRSEQSLAYRLRLALEDLGPTAIKFGQVMSTRPDLILTSEPRDARPARLQAGRPSSERRRGCRRRGAWTPSAAEIEVEAQAPCGCGTGPRRRAS